MANLPIQKSDDQDLMLLQTKWKAAIDPILSFPVNSGVILSNVGMQQYKNVINHKLGRKLQGWIVIRSNRDTTFYDDQDNNQQPDLTLVLYAADFCTISLLVF